MKIPSRNCRTRALTMMDVAIIIAVLAVLAVFGWNGIVRERNLQARVMRVQCAHNLRTIGFAFNVWAEEHSSHYPMTYSQAIGGSEEFTTGTNAWRHFQVLSNYVPMPRVFLCPADEHSSRPPDARFAAPSFADLGNGNISYFVGIDAKKGFGTSFLTGDRNITNAIGIKDGLLELTTNTPADWTTAIHVKKGAVLFVDGSVHQLSPAGWRAAIAETGLATNRLQIPVTTP